mmetsp:Transcript_794/g.1714  ORF Transcript_794/g.1714 Transcript_794/m.1714 type:complete len:1013 (-) Transcript_794:86-3124(-)
MTVAARTAGLAIAEQEADTGGCKHHLNDATTECGLSQHHVHHIWLAETSLWPGGKGSERSTFVWQKCQVQSGFAGLGFTSHHWSESRRTELLSASCSPLRGHAKQGSVFTLCDSDSDRGCSGIAPRLLRHCRSSRVRRGTRLAVGGILIMIMIFTLQSVLAFIPVAHRPAGTGSLAVGTGQASAMQSMPHSLADDLFPGRDFLQDGPGSFVERATTLLDVLWTRVTCFGDGCRVVLADSATKAYGSAAGSALAAWNSAMRYEGQIIYSLFQQQLGVFIPRFQRETQIEADFIFHRSFWLRNLTASPAAFSVLLSLLPPGLNFTSCFISDVKVSWAANPSNLWRLPITIDVESVWATADEVPAGSEEEVEALIQNWLTLTGNRGQEVPFQGTYPLLDGATFRVARVELNVTSPTRYGNVSLQMEDLEVRAVDNRGRTRDLDLLCKSGLHGEAIRFYRLIECKEAAILQQPQHNADTDLDVTELDSSSSAEDSSISAHSTGAPGGRSRRKRVVLKRKLKRAWRRWWTGTASKAGEEEDEHLDGDHVEADPPSQDSRGDAYKEPMRRQNVEAEAERPTILGAHMGSTLLRNMSQDEQDEKLKELLVHWPYFPEENLSMSFSEPKAQESVVVFEDWEAAMQDEVEVPEVAMAEWSLVQESEPMQQSSLPTRSHSLGQQPPFEAGGVERLISEATEDVWQPPTRNGVSLKEANASTQVEPVNGQSFAQSAVPGGTATEGVAAESQQPEPLTFAGLGEFQIDPRALVSGKVVPVLNGASDQNVSLSGDNNTEATSNEDKGWPFHLSWHWLPWVHSDHQNESSGDSEISISESSSFETGRRRRHPFWPWKGEEGVEEDLNVDVEVEDEDEEEEESEEGKYVIAPTSLQILAMQSKDVRDMRRTLEQSFELSFPGPFSAIAVPPLLTGGAEDPPPDRRLDPFPAPPATWSFKVVRRNPLWGRPHSRPLYRRLRGVISMTICACIVSSWLLATWTPRPWLRVLISKAQLFLPHVLRHFFSG